jgi:TolB-like protein/class 3 adenylate cyclase/Tfp pilus assembly protein PilF
VAREQRKLAAILAADVVGYSRLMGRDESGTLARLRKNRSERLDPVLARYGGRLVKLTGDGALIEFASAVDALSAAIEFQQAMADANRDQLAELALEFRLGLHLGDLIVEGDDLYGDGVNIAARLEAEAPARGIVISRTVHEAVAGRLNATFEDLGNLDLKNIDRPVHAFSVSWQPQDWQPSAASDATQATKAASRTPLALPDKPSIAVLPFQNMSGDPEQEYFADGMAEEIITALSRIRWLFVIARNSSFTYKGQTVAIKQVGRELGVRYVLEGSVRKAGAQVRITAQLIEAESGTHLWADRFDGSLDDVFELQDRVATRVAGVIEPTLQATEIRRSRDRPTDDLTAYDLYLRALPTLFSDTVDEVAAALGLLDQAIARDPNYGPALAAAAYCYVQLTDNRVTDDPERSRRTGIEHARHAIAVAPEDSTTIAHAAMALALLGEDLETMIGLLDKALALNPSFARGWYLSARLKLRAGDADAAIERVQTSLRLNPRAALGTPAPLLGAAYFLKRQYDRALPWLLTAVQERPKSLIAHTMLVACYGQMGRPAEARQIMDRERHLRPVATSAAASVYDPEFRSLINEGLRLALGETG